MLSNHPKKMTTHSQISIYNSLQSAIKRISRFSRCSGGRENTLHRGATSRYSECLLGCSGGRSKVN